MFFILIFALLLVPVSAGGVEKSSVEIDLSDNPSKYLDYMSASYLELEQVGFAITPRFLNGMHKCLDSARNVKSEVVLSWDSQDENVNFKVYSGRDNYLFVLSSLEPSGDFICYVSKLSGDIVFFKQLH